MRISDWSSDVCSSDLLYGRGNGRGYCRQADGGWRFASHASCRAGKGHAGGQPRHANLAGGPWRPYGARAREKSRADRCGWSHASLQRRREIGPVGSTGGENGVRIVTGTDSKTGDVIWRAEEQPYEI